MAQVLLREPGWRVGGLRGPRLLLLALMATLLLAAVGCPRDVSDLRVDEKTVLLAAMSLGRDGDLRFEDDDRQRLEKLGGEADQIQLRKSGPGEGERYDVVPFYPQLLAPFVALAPRRGAAIANACLMILAAVIAARSIGRRIGSSSMSLIGIGLFASVSYRHVFVVQPASVLFCAVVTACALAYAHEEPATHDLGEIYKPPEESGRVVLRWLGIGLLLGMVSSIHLAYLLLLLPALAAAPAGRRAAAAGSLVVGSTLSLTLAFWMIGLPQQAPTLASLIPSGSLDIGLVLWNQVYQFFGRNTGLVFYFLPALALVGLWQGGSGRSTLVASCIVGTVLMTVLMPFNYFGGPAAVANSWFLPWFAALFFIPVKPLPRGWVVATLALAAPMMYPTWLSTSTGLLDEAGQYRHTAGRLQRFLPLETTLQHLPRGGEVASQGLWVGSSSRQAVVGGASRWQMNGPDAELVLASTSELSAVFLQFDSRAEAELQVRGGEVGDMVLQPAGGVGFRLESLKRRAIHPMWWSQEKHYLYRLVLHMPLSESTSTSFSIVAFAAGLRSGR